MAIKASAAITLSCVVDVASTTRYYLLRASTQAAPARPTENPPGGGWDDAEPGYVTGSTNTLYFTDLTVFSDGSWSYSAVSVSSAYEAAKAAYNKAQAAQAAAQQALSNTEVIVGTQTKATSRWTGNASFSQLLDGQQIVYWLPYAYSSGDYVPYAPSGGSSANGTGLNLTLADGTETGFIPCFYGGTTRITNHYGAGTVVRLLYRENVVVGGYTYAAGWWADANYDSNNYDRIRFNNAVKAKTAISASRLIVGDSGGFFHLAAGSVFDVDKPILWAGSAISANATGTNNYLSIPSATLRNNAGSTWTATQYATLYLAGTLAGNTFTVATSNWLTTAPSDASLTYISLGYMYSTYQMYLYPEHPMFRLVDGELKAVSQIACEAMVAAAEASEAVEALDDSLTQQEIFNRLTDNGAAQGMVLYDGQLYVNASYINAGVIRNSENDNNYWNLLTGDFSATQGSLGEFTINAQGLSKSDTGTVYDYDLSIDPNSIKYQRTRHAGNLISRTLLEYASIYLSQCYDDDFNWANSRITGGQDTDTGAAVLTLYAEGQLVGRTASVRLTSKDHGDGGTLTVNANLKVTGETSLDTPLPVASGGTGADAAGWEALTNLGLKLASVEVNLSAQTWTQSSGGKYYTPQLSVSGASKLLAATITEWQSLRSTDHIDPVIKENSFGLMANVNTFVDTYSRIVVKILYV